MHSSAISSTRPDSNMTRCLLYLLLLLLVDVGMVTMTPDGASDFDPSSYCDNVCRVGRGGNVCKCSSPKFAGKRSRTALLLPFHSGSAKSPDGGAVTHLLRVASRQSSNLQDLDHSASRWNARRLRYPHTTATNNNFQLRSLS